jgi:GDP-L-fucose synthase
MNKKRTIITGGSGLLGNALKNILADSCFPTSKELDLNEQINVEKFLSNNDFETVIHLAAKVGGIKANTNYVSDFYQINSQINNNIISSCISNKIPKLVCCLSTCIYPDEKYVKYPLTEEQLHNGPPHESNFGYAYAKRMVDVQLRAIRQQHGLNYISVIPNNLYGENDNFDLENSHVIPALIRKIWEAKINNRPYFEVWGDGEVYREFTYSQDIAKIILFCLQNYDDEYPINIGNTEEYLLKDAIMMIKKQLDYSGEIVFDTTKPKGQIRKPSSNKKLLDLGWKKEDYTPIEVGLKNTCEWFIKNYPNVRGIK